MKSRPTSLQDCSTILLDVGGTLRIGKEVIPGAPEFVRTLKRRNKNHFILSNTTGISAATLTKQLKKFGFKFNEEQVITANTAAIAHLKRNNINTVFVIGTNEQKEEYERSGFTVTHENAQAVLVSLDYELDYAKLAVADFLLRKGASFIATNTDTHIVTPEGLLPDAGGTVGFLTATTGRQPEVTGKPSQLMMDLVKERAPGETSHMAIIGDNLEVEMKLAQDYDLLSVLVLSGKTTRENLTQSAYQPDYVVESVENLIPLFS